jgi:hypothetical protein
VKTGRPVGGEVGDCYCRASERYAWEPATFDFFWLHPNVLKHLAKTRVSELVQWEITNFTNYPNRVPYEPPPA